MMANLMDGGRESTQRVFVALWPESALQQQLHSLGGQLKKQVGGRVPQAENMHLTLVFLGNLMSPQLETVRRIVSETKCDPITLSLDTLGYWRKPRIVWLGPAKPPSALFTCQERLVTCLRQFGFFLDDRPYKPHITLLRKAKRAPRFDPQTLAWRAERLIVALSISSSAGVEYRLLDADVEGFAEDDRDPHS